MVSIVVPFLGLPFRILNIELVKPKKGTTMETIGIEEGYLHVVYSYSKEPQGVILVII